jgi:hypothetical protein
MWNNDEFYLFQSMLEINEISYIITIYNTLPAPISSSPRAGRETFPNPNFPLRPPGPQIASLRSEMLYTRTKRYRRDTVPVAQYYSVHIYFFGVNTAFFLF